jgi:transcription-repair coupling factor (superfamily II helicase)
MNLAPLLSLLSSEPEYSRLVNTLRAAPGAPALPLVLGLPRAARAMVLADLARSGIGPIILVTARPERALVLRDELTSWNADLEPLVFAEPTPLFYEASAWGPRTVRERITCLARLSEHALPAAREAHPLILITSARAMLAPTIPQRAFLTATRLLSPEYAISPEAFARFAIDSGYRAESLVVEPGHFSRRGGLLDIWPPADALPTRVEFFGDTIETMRCFDPATQRTGSSNTSLRITPARELLPADAARLAPLAEGEGDPAAEYRIPLIYPSASVLDHLPKHGVIAVEDLHELRGTIDELEEHALQLRQEAIDQAGLNADAPLANLSWDDVQEGLESRRVVLLGGDAADAESERLPLGEAFAPPPRFGGQLKSFVEQAHTLRQNGARVVVVSRQADRLVEVWSEQRRSDKPPAPPLESLVTAPAESDLVFVHGTLQEGFTLRALALFTDGEIFGWMRPEPRRRPAAKMQPPETAYGDLQPGDYVVHIEYGIGQFTGLVTRTFDGMEREYLLVEFGDGGQVFVPVHQADRITKYIGADDKAPTLSRLGSPEWVAAREKARVAAVEVARDMLALYAKREASTGHASAPDTIWQSELESAFPYTETEDQLRAIEEVKRDMERLRPMDRLICGDVGYGKTEVALRAAFKAVMDGRQVGLLVPTTVLAQQHFQTFSQRLAAYPVRLGMLSRFRTPSEQEQTLAQLAAGEVDIVIGTHRLIQRDVAFHDLGLVIIDEEQRFGVSHKEHLKKLRAEVDVLTLTATPIPRTLYLSLAGVRDISMINTPPDERLPVITHVGNYSETLVRQAILRELERGGQVFYLHNRVESIRVVEHKLAALVPEARIRIGHGQMAEHELERAMDAFLSREADILLCTSIIESGLDIPNANTLIIDRADTFGLAQLYQLRGRVGRGPARAYAYFFTDRHHRPTPEAYERLQTLAEQTELGAGYAVAMRDLEIRGAGEILGTRQSGHIAAIGFHLYTRLLASAVRRMRAEQSGAPSESEPLPATVDLPLAASLPEAYVPDRSLRLRLYRRLADISAREAVGALRQELVDRFGPLPSAAENLLFQLEIKTLAQQAGVESVAMEGGVLVLRAAWGEENRPEHTPVPVRVSKGCIYLPAASLPEEWRPMLVETLLWLGNRVRRNGSGLPNK